MRATSTGRLALAACAVLFLPLAAAASLAAAATSVTTIDADAHYPEGPVWRDGALLYVEYSAGNIKRWDGSRSAVVWHRDGCGPNALIGYRGHLLVACYDADALVELDSAWKTVGEIHADSSGRHFTGPNDFAADGHGGVYFSASGRYELAAPITGAVLHLAADGRLTELANTIHYSNGLTLTADGRHLLVAEMLAGRVLSFPVEADGSLGPRTVWARLQDLAPPTPNMDAYNGPDGVKLGSDGNYYIAQNGSGRVLVVSEDRKLVRSIDVPTPFVTNVGFGPDGAATVFVTGAFEQWKEPYQGAVYRWTR